MAEIHTVSDPLVLFIDPRALTRAGLSLWLSSSLVGYSVCVAASVDEGVKLVPDAAGLAMVLLHVGRHTATAPHVAAALARQEEAFPGTPVATVAEAEDAASVLTALHAGIRGYIPTSLSAAIAVEAMRLVCAGDIYAPASSLLQPAARAAHNPTEAAPAEHGFSPRQLQIIGCLRRGIANKAIAFELNMSQGTVKVHLRNIMKRLGAQNRTQIVIKTDAMIASGQMPRL